MVSKILLSLAAARILATFVSAGPTVLHYIPSPADDQVGGPPGDDSTLIDVSAIGVNDAGATTYVAEVLVTDGPEPTTISYTWVEDATHYVEVQTFTTLSELVSIYEECRWNSNNVGVCTDKAAEYLDTSAADAATAVPFITTAREWTGSVLPWYTAIDVTWPTTSLPPAPVVTSPPAPLAAMPSNNFVHSWGVRSRSVEEARAWMVLFGSVLVMYLVL